MAAIFEDGQTCLTLFWKGTTQGSFHQSLVQNGYVVSEELMIMWKVYDYNRDKNEHPPLSSNHWTQKKTSIYGMLLLSNLQIWSIIWVDCNILNGRKKMVIKALLLNFWKAVQDYFLNKSGSHSWYLYMLYLSSVCPTSFHLLAGKPN